MSPVALISVLEQLVIGTEQLRKCSEADDKLFRDSYESAPEQL